MPRDTSIADRLRRANLRVREVKGWETGGDSLFTPDGSVQHHTAGPHFKPGVPNAPSLGIIINGRGGPDPLSGPLANVYQAFDDTVYVVAAGRANHAGLPDGDSCRGMKGNSDAFGLETEHDGVSKLPAKRQLVAARIHAALAHGRWDQGQVVQHREWAPSRKPDLATSFSTLEGANGFRKLIKEQLDAGIFRVTVWDVHFTDGKGTRQTRTTKNTAAWLNTPIGKAALQRRPGPAFTPHRF